MDELDPQSGNPEKTNRPAWDIDTTHPDLVITIRAALQQVMDPELGKSIIQLGLVRNVTISEGALVISMIMTTPFCPYAPAMIDATKAKAEEVVNMPVIMALGMEPWDFSMMEDTEGFEWGLY